MSKVIRVVPLTDEELTEIQLTVASRIMELHQQSASGHINEAEAADEISRLSSVMKKCSHYRPEKTQKVAAI